MVRAKAEAALAAGLTAILCVGETEAERDAGHTLDIVARQLEGSLPQGADASNLAVAYEPVWAIGSGRTPTLAEVAEVHGFLRAQARRPHRRSGGQGPAALRRFGQACQRARTCSASPMSTAHWSAAPA